MKKFLNTLSFASLLTASLASMAGPLQDYTLLLQDDFNVPGSGHIQGKAFIGGDLNTYSNWEVMGVGVAQNPKVTTTEVVGNLNGAVTMESGYLDFGGTNNLGNNINCNGGFNDKSCVRQTLGLETKSAEIFGLLSQESNYYKNLTASGSVDLQNSRFKYTGAATDLAVFNLDGSNLFNRNWELDFGAAQNVVINVSGNQLINGSYANLNNGFSDSQRPHILWNFFEASSIDFGSSNWRGSVLALDASIMTSSNFDGSLAARTYRGAGEFHSFTWAYEPPPFTVPEPSILLLLSSALGVLALVRLRRRKPE
jgi:choice-of-anchor A domain-containing protein